MQLEQADLKGTVDQVRDAAVDLMGRSEKYAKMVEPELSALNQRWSDVSERLKVCIIHASL